MQKLVEGIHQFQATVFRPQFDLFQRLANAQDPLALFITCSDSRIDPNLLTQTDPGDLFLLRNAGNLVPPYGDGGGESATIEFALNALKVRDIILCGHTDCGAMKGLLDPCALHNMPQVEEWLVHAERTRRIIRSKYHHLEGRALISACVAENVLVQLENLRTHPSVARALDEGRLTLHGWVYKIETGEVFAFDPERGQFVTLSEPCATEAGDGALQLATA